MFFPCSILADDLNTAKDLAARATGLSKIMDSELKKEHVDNVDAQTKVVSMLADPGNKEIGVAGMEARLKDVEKKVQTVEAGVRKEVGLVLEKEGGKEMARVKREVGRLARASEGV